jgi:catalase-peroxidase
MTFMLIDRATGENRFIATRSDLVFGSNSQLRAVAEAFAGRDGQKRFVRNFVKAWNKVMMLDRFDMKV